jgi:hypothetical protein
MTEAEYRPVLLAHLVRDAEWYPRQGLSLERVADYETFYRENGPGALPPITVGLMPSAGHPWLVDGWHRVAAAERAGLERLPAVVNEYPDEWAAFADAVRLANCGPLSLRPAERGSVIDRFLEQFPEASDRELASQMGVSHVAVWKRRQKVHEEPAARDPLADQARALEEQARALARAWENACAGRLPSLGPLDGDPSALALALREAFTRRKGSEAALWLQALEAATRSARQRIASEGGARP